MLSGTTIIIAIIIIIIIAIIIVAILPTFLQRCPCCRIV